MKGKRGTPAHEELLTDEEIRRKHLEDRGVMRRAREAAERVRSGAPAGPGITEKDLPDFLREHG